MDKTPDSSIQNQNDSTTAMDAQTRNIDGIGSGGSDTVSSSGQGNRQHSTTVVINTEKTSTSLFLLCFFFPFITPVVALIKGQLGFILVILVLWFISFIMLFIPIFGWLVILIIDVIIAMKIAKMKNKTEVVVTPNM